MFIRISKLTCTRMEEGINGLLLVSLGGVSVRRIVYKWFDINKSKHRTSKHQNIYSYIGKKQRNRTQGLRTFYKKKRRVVNIMGHRVIAILFQTRGHPHLKRDLCRFVIT